MPGLDLLMTNLLSPIVLAFALGAVAGFIRSELELPEAVLKLISIYLLFSIGLTGGRELAQVSFREVSALIVAAVVMTVAIPLTTYAVLRRAGGFDVANAAAVAAPFQHAQQRGGAVGMVLRDVEDRVDHRLIVQHGINALLHIKRQAKTLVGRPAGGWS